MAGTTTKQQGPYPTGPDAPYVHLDLKALAEWADGRLVTYCTEATKPTGVNRYVGAQIAVTDSVSAQFWDGTAWRFLPLSNGRFLQAGSAVVTTNAAGGFSVTYAVAYPTGTIPALTVCDGDSSGSNINLVGIIYSQVSNTGFGGVARSSASSLGAVISGIIRVGWTASA